MKLGFVAVVVAGLAGCPAPVGSRAPVPSDSTAQCREYCQNIGLPLESVVIMASNVGCVCDARPAPAPMGPPSASPAPTGATGASSTAGGMAAVMMEQEAAEQQQQQQNQQIQQQSLMHH